MRNINSKLILGIFAPTASNKSLVAKRLAQTGRYVIINADSRQIYKDLNVLSAVGDIPDNHELYAILECGESINAVQWVNIALEKVEQAFTNNLIPVLVGGTGMYFKFFKDGSAQLPKIEHSILQEVEKYTFNEQLKMLPPEVTLKFKDKMRIKKALAIQMQTNRSILEFFEHNVLFHNYSFEILALSIEKSILWNNIWNRLQGMFPQVLDEVSRFIEKYPNLRSNVIGFDEIKDFLESKSNNIQNLQEKIFYKTRQYAKRQKTYLNQLKAERIFSDHEALYEYIISKDMRLNNIL